MTKLRGGSHERFARRNQWVVTEVDKCAPQCANLDLSALKAKGDELRDKLKDNPKPTDLLPLVFALVREASTLTLGLRHFDVQLIGGYALYSGMIAEMKTGEGKTLTATLPAAFVALTGKQVHMVTVNDYLAKRDANWMRPVFEALGLSVGVLVVGASAEEKKSAYAADIVYGTNNQFGFDFLNDNMIHDPTTRLQQSQDFAIVDEVDSILVDEARTPLAISGTAGDLTQQYLTCDAVARDFVRGEEIDEAISADFAIDEKTRQIHLSDEGYEKAEAIFAKRGLLHDGGLYEAHNLSLMHHLVSALRARHLFARDKDYVVSEGRIVIVDEHTGRLMPGRRWGDGLHQAIEAKEGVHIEPETITLAAVTLQNFYRGYELLAGMTGTAQTEAEEFGQIYGLEVASIPTHRTMIRDDQLDRVFAKHDSKLTAILADIKDCHTRGQPVLVGTTTIDSSEKIAALLAKDKISCELLNAKQHEREAEIIAQAGMAGKVTISTSMAGRGTDIVLGGNIEHERERLKTDESLDDSARTAKLATLENDWQKRHDDVVAAGGLRIIGTERHESRRIDNQLRGRSGRQGDPGSSVFYLSFEDPLLRIFTDVKFKGMLEKLMGDDTQPLEVAMVSRVIEKAQRQMEAYNYDIRKQLLEYDDITNDQRKIVYEQRRHIVDQTNIAAIVEELVSGSVEHLLGEHINPEAPEEEWDVEAASESIKKSYGLDLPIAKWLEEDADLDVATISKRAVKLTFEAMWANLAELGDESERFQKSIILEVLDTNWRLHINALDSLRQGIGLRGFAQKNPKQEYRRESMALFNTMLETVRNDTARFLLTVRRKSPEEAQQQQQARRVARPAPSPQPAPATSAQPASVAVATVGRNHPCPCGSGKKYKHCHGRKHGG